MTDMPYPRQPRCARCARAAREHGLCKAHLPRWRKSGKSLADYLADTRIPLGGVPVPDYDPARYRIFDDGSVWSNAKGRGRWRRLATGLNNGSLRVGLTDGLGHSTSEGVAALVLRAFGSPRPIGQVPFHWPDTDPRNCRLDNLRWVPAGTVMLGRDPLPGRHHDQRGSKNNASRMTEEAVQVARDLARAGQTVGAICEALGVSESAIRSLLKGKAWRHMPDPLGPIVLDTRARGTDVNTAKLDELAVQEIRRRAAAGESQYELASQYGVSQGAISRIIRRTTWRHVLDD